MVLSFEGMNNYGYWDYKLDAVLFVKVDLVWDRSNLFIYMKQRLCEERVQYIDIIKNQYIITHRQGRFYET
jgi:hypothetical protein